jgi:hypothetical protein
MFPIAHRLPIWIAAIAVITGVMLFPHDAAAQYDHIGEDPVVWIIAASVLPIPVADVVFTGYDLTKASEGERASKAMAITETAVALPQAVVASVFLADTSSQSTKFSWPLCAYTFWMWGLSAHGIASLAPPSSASAPPSPSQRSPSDPFRAHVSFAPTMVTDGARQLPGVGAVGQF